MEKKFVYKTEDGKRIIALDDDTINILTIWRNRQMEIGLGNSNDFIFSYDGLPMIKSTIGRITKRCSQFAGVTRIQAKGLRHSHASYLGHSSPEITLKHYAHMWSVADTAIVNAMTGNIEIKTSERSKIKFKGNQVLNKSNIRG